MSTYDGCTLPYSDIISLQVISLQVLSLICRGSVDFLITLYSVLSHPEVANMRLPSETTFGDWINTHRYHHADFSLSHSAFIVKTLRLKVVVIIPAKEVASTIAGVLRETVRPLITAGIVSSIIVIDANSEDKTAEVAAKHGATVIQRADIAPELGPSQGKGDALWRALKVTDGDVVAFLDGDTGDPNPAHLLGILGPLLLNDKIHMVRGCFDRPFTTPNGESHANEGGRVTELTARPLLNQHFPQLAGFRQPLAGEFAARRPLLEKIDFPVGYGIEIGSLIDAWRLVGLRGLAEVDLGTRQSMDSKFGDHQSEAVLTSCHRCS
jgi:glucosyl-3-phosphoglycerate synthase